MAEKGLTLAQASKRSGRAQGTLRNQILKGKLKGEKDDRGGWRVTERELARYMDKVARDGKEKAAS